MIGIDVVDIADFGERFRTTRWLRLAFTGREREAANQLSPARRAVRLAETWASKEAVAKALGTGFRGELTPLTIEVDLNREIPGIELSGQAAPGLLVTVDSDAVHAVAMCLSLDAGPGAPKAWGVSK